MTDLLHCTKKLARPLAKGKLIFHGFNNPRPSLQSAI
jgi:hypothetical protein